MINSRNIRFLLGIIILFSIFLFMGTESEESCLICFGEDYPYATVTLINQTDSKIKVQVVSVSKSSATSSFVVYIEVGGRKTSSLSNGTYTFTATASPYYNNIFWGGAVLIDTKKIKSYNVIIDQ